jgi:signal transduction histidine kinase
MIMAVLKVSAMPYRWLPHAECRGESIVKILDQVKSIQNLRPILIAVLIVQALYWLAYLPLVAPKQLPLDRVALYEASHAALSTPDWAEVQKAKFQPVELPWETCCDAGYHAVRIHFDLDRVEDQGLALVPVVGSDNFQARVNGTLVFAEGRMHLPDQSYHGQFRGTLRVPASTLHSGKNELVFTLVRGTADPYFFVGQSTLGQYQAVRAYYAPRAFMLNQYLTISLTIALLVAAIGLIVWLRGGLNGYFLWLAVLAICWAMGILYNEIADPVIRGKARLGLMTLFMTLLPVAWLNLVNAWDRKQLRWVPPASLALTAACIAAFWWILWADWKGGLDTIYAYVTIFSGVMALGTTVLLLRKLPGLQLDRRWEFAIYLALCMVLLRDGINAFTNYFHYDLLEMSVPVLLTALVIAFIARDVRLFRSSEQIAAMLQTQLTQRTAELEAAHGREKDLVRSQAHQAERQRIMRDMHDGLGSQLMSMLLAARRGVAKPAAVAEGLQSVIDEMRLLIDSMDSVGESLGSAFAMFRERVQGRVEAAGMAFNWHDDSQGRLPDMGPREVLQVFRIMQEAVTNALKHSTGTALSISIAPSPQAGRSIRIVIADNGGGLGKANPRGKGMDSMTARAEGIGGKLQVQSGAEGVSVFLDLPQR